MGSFAENTTKGTGQVFLDMVKARNGESYENVEENELEETEKTEEDDLIECDTSHTDMQSLDYLKVVGGAVAGVGTIVALPIFGSIGTITAGGAILGSLLGAGAGVAVVSEDEEEL